jgi:hypothetical protein
MLIVRVACDDPSGGPANGESTLLSVSDSQGNTYTRIREFRRDPSSTAADGVIGGLFYSVLATALANGTDQITLTSPSVAARTIAASEFSFSGTLTIEQSSTTGGNTANPSRSLSSMTSRDYLLIGALAREAPTGTTYTHDADYTQMTITGTTGSGNASNVSVISGYRLATLTDDTYGITQVAMDWAIIVVAFYEAGAPPSGQPTQVRTQGTPTGSGYKDRPGRWN